MLLLQNQLMKSSLVRLFSSACFLILSSAFRNSVSFILERFSFIWTSRYFLLLSYFYVYWSFKTSQEMHFAIPSIFHFFWGRILLLQFFSLELWIRVPNSQFPDTCSFFIYLHTYSVVEDDHYSWQIFRKTSETFPKWTASLRTASLLWKQNLTLRPATSPGRNLSHYHRLNKKNKIEPF